MKKIKVLALIFIAAFALAMVGCGEHNGVPEDYTVKVTYCFNGGSMSGYTDRTELDVYYKQGSLIAEPEKSTSELPAPTRIGYSIGGWYVAETDEEGEVVRDEDGTPIATSRKFNFKTDRVEKDIWLVVSWVRKIQVTFVNLYQRNVSKPYSKDYESGQAFTQPPLRNSWVNGENVDIMGFFWSYDAETDEYSDQIDFTDLTFDDLYARLAENSEAEDDYLLLNVYVKLVKKIRITFVNLYEPYLTTLYTSVCQSGQAFNRPDLETSWVNGKAVEIEGYYWSYDEETGEYFDPIEFDDLTFDDLYARLPENPEKDGNYLLFNVYVKLAQD